MFTLLTNFARWEVDPQKGKETNAKGGARTGRKDANEYRERDTGRFHEDTIEARNKLLPNPKYDGGKHGPYVVMVEEVPAWDLYGRYLGSDLCIKKKQL